MCGAAVTSGSDQGCETNEKGAYECLCTTDKCNTAVQSVSVGHLTAVGCVVLTALAGRIFGY